MAGRIALALALACAARSARAKPSVELLSAADGAALKAVFFSGAPWLVQCGTRTDLAAAASDPSLGLHEVVERALLSLPTECRVGLLDCRQKLPSGKTVLERFKLDGAVAPTLIVAANALPPAQVTAEQLAKHGGLGGVLFPTVRQQAVALAALVGAKIEPKATVLTRTEHLQSHCLKRRHCALVLSPRVQPKADVARVVKTLMKEFRDVCRPLAPVLTSCSFRRASLPSRALRVGSLRRLSRLPIAQVSFVTLNTARYDFALSKRLPAPPAGASSQLVAFRSAPAKGENKKKGMHVWAKALRGELSAAGPGREFLRQLTAGELEMSPISRVPAISWRKQGGQKEGKGGGAKSKPGGQGVSAGGDGGRRRRAATSGGAAGARSRTSSHNVAASRSAEAKRRQQMAEEEEEYVQGMFASADGDEDDEGEEEDGDVEEMELEEEEEEETATETRSKEEEED